MKSHTQADDLEHRLIEFAASIIRFSSGLPKTPTGRHISMQILRCGTASAANYAEARGAESRSDFIHKLGIVRKELNETAVWLRIVAQDVAEKPENIVAIIEENLELARIISASIRTARSNGSKNDTDHRPPTNGKFPSVL
jgi:four helix bundle protein